MPPLIHHWKNPSVQEKFHSPNIHTDAGFHPTSHSVVTESCFPRGKEDGMSGQPLFSIWCQKSRINGTTHPLTLYGFMAFIGTTFTPPYYNLLSRHFHRWTGLNQHIPPWEHDVLHIQVNLSGIKFLLSLHPTIICFSFILSNHYHIQ